MENNIKEGRNSNFGRARKAKNDEFYTSLQDILNEVLHYKKQLKDKIIYCNANDGELSNFYQIFSSHFYFNLIGIKKLITISYGSNGKQAYKLEVTNKGLGFKKTSLEGNGDFRSKECIELLKESDVVITNPPFSLFREYIKQLIDYDKKFLVIGSNLAVKNRGIFPLFREGKIKSGYTTNSGLKFGTIEGKVKAVAISWYTNLYLENYKPLVSLEGLYKKYDECSFPKYDNYNAINVNRVKNIPNDYYGIMGVPITYMFKHNPNLFKLIGLARKGHPHGDADPSGEQGDATLDNRIVYTRVLIQRK